MPEQHDGRNALKRRGLIAGAAALMAGIAAKRVAEPVAAAAGMQFADTTTTVTNTAQGTTILTGSPGTVFHVVNTITTSGYALNASCDNASYGFGVIATGTGYGVSATGNQYAGVFGDTSNASAVGVSGYNRAASAGVGVSGYGNGIGVSGQSSGTGVSGQTSGGFGVYGSTTSGVGTYGYASGAGTGLFGYSTGGTGVYGATNASNQYGVLGTATAANATAVAGIANQNGSSAFSGGTTNPNAFAGVFQGTVVVQGKLVVSDPSYKSGALAHPDGSHRLVYCVESPESWIEDFGEGTLNGGKATVTFDPDFAAVVHTDTYHVFLAAYGADSPGLNVVEQHPGGFTVTERNKGTGNGRFSWRVVVKPKTTAKSERLGKFAMPNVPLPDSTKFKPTAPSNVPAPNVPAPKKP